MSFNCKNDESGRILFNDNTHRLEIISTRSIVNLFFFSILSVFFTDISCFDYENLRELHQYFDFTISYCQQILTFNLLFMVFKYGYVYIILPFPVALVMKIILHCFHEIHVLAQLYILLYTPTPTSTSTHYHYTRTHTHNPNTYIYPYTTTPTLTCPNNYMSLHIHLMSTIIQTIKFDLTFCYGLIII